MIPGLLGDTKVDTYSLNIAESQTLTLAADSESFPPMILIFDNKDALVNYALNERFRTHAEVTATLPPASYKVAVTTLLPLQGSYTLTTKSVQVPAATQ